MPPFAIGKTPVMPVVNGRPVQFVSVPLVGVPSIGVTSVGDVANTEAPVPVSSVNALLRFALEGVAKNVATPVPRPLTPVLIGSPVQFVNVPLVGVPKIGVVSVGDVAKTSRPLPVSSVTAAAAFALEGVARNVATPVPNPETPVEIGNPVAFVSVAALGVPRFGVVSEGDVASTTVLPLPVVVAALIAVPFPASAGAFIVVVSVSVGAFALPSDVPASPFAVATATLETVPPPVAYDST